MRADLQERSCCGELYGAREGLRNSFEEEFADPLDLDPAEYILWLEYRVLTGE